MPETRTNEGYIITDCIHFGDEEFVLGELTNSYGFKQYVTWRCKNKTDYYWGHYFLNRPDAVMDLCGRVNKEVDAALGIKNENASGTANTESVKEKNIYTGSISPVRRNVK